MLFTPDCILCNYRAALAAIRQLTSDETTIRTMMTKISEIPSLRGLDWSTTSPEVLELVFRKISTMLGDSDPFQSLKDNQNEKGLQLYSWLQALVAEADDSLNVAINLAIIGNSLDLMWSRGSVDIEPVIDDKLEKPLPRESYQDLKRKLQSSKLLVYFADNCGEIVFDKLLVETIKKEVDLEVVFVVRSVPTLNDVTLREAGLAGIDEVARVVGNGIDGPLPGTILSRCSKEVQEITWKADVVISKGGGNFDTLDEEKTLPEDTFFLLMCKCIPYQNLFSIEIAHPILSKRIHAGR
jgi:uncharacterized protein with ATP-grasp and redox domains